MLRKYSKIVFVCICESEDQPKTSTKTATPRFSEAPAFLDFSAAPKEAAVAANFQHYSIFPPENVFDSSLILHCSAFDIIFCYMTYIDVYVFVFFDEWKNHGIDLFSCQAKVCFFFKPRQPAPSPLFEPTSIIFNYNYIHHPYNQSNPRRCLFPSDLRFYGGAGSGFLYPPLQ